MLDLRPQISNLRSQKSMVSAVTVSVWAPGGLGGPDGPAPAIPAGCGGVAIVGPPPFAMACLIFSVSSYTYFCMDSLALATMSLNS